MSSPREANGYGEIHGNGRTRGKQKEGGAGNVRATQGDADDQVLKSRMHEKAQAVCKMAPKTGKTKTAHREMSSAVM